MPDDDEIRVQGLKISGCVAQRLAFLKRRSLGREVDDVGGKALFGKFEADPGACGRLDKKVNDGFASQCRHLLNRAFTDCFKRASGVENGYNLLWRERFDVEQMFSIPTHALISLPFPF